MGYNKTKLLKKEEASHEWFIVDVSDKVLGRAATRIANLLSGKYRRDYTPHVDSGAGVVVLNCGKVRTTGNKAGYKNYENFSGYPGGLKRTSFEAMKEKNPKHILKHAVKGMLPKNKLGALMLKRLKLYEGKEHSQTAQKPVEFKL